VISVGIAPAESLLSLWTGDEKFSPSRFGVTNHNDKKKKKKKRKKKKKGGFDERTKKI